MKYRRITTSICAPVTVEMIVGKDDEDDDWEVVSVLSTRVDNFSPEAVTELMDDDDLEYVGKLASKATQCSKYGVPQ